MSRPKGSKNKKKIPESIPIGPVANSTIIKATLKILGRTFTSQGNTIDEVLNGFEPQGLIKAAGVLTIEKDGIIKEKIIAKNHINNIFGMASGTLRTVSLKWIKQLFE